MTWALLLEATWRKERADFKLSSDYHTWLTQAHGPAPQETSAINIFFYSFLKRLNPAVTGNFVFIVYYCWPEIWLCCIIAQASLKAKRSACSWLLSAGLVMRILIIVELFLCVGNFTYRQRFCVRTWSRRVHWRLRAASHCSDSMSEDGRQGEGNPWVHATHLLAVGSATVVALHRDL